MTKAILKTKLQKAVEQLEDETMLEALYNVVTAHLQTGDEEDKTAKGAATVNAKSKKKSR